MAFNRFKLFKYLRLKGNAVPVDDFSKKVLSSNEAFTLFCKAVQIFLFISSWILWVMSSLFKQTYQLPGNLAVISGLLHYCITFYGINGFRLPHRNKTKICFRVKQITPLPTNKTSEALNSSNCSMKITKFLGHFRTATLLYSRDTQKK